MEIVCIIVCTLSYFVGYWVRAYQDDLLFYNRTRLSMLECLEMIEGKIREFEFFENQDEKFFENINDDRKEIDDGENK